MAFNTVSKYAALVVLLIIMAIISALFFLRMQQADYQVVLEKPVKRLKIHAPVEFNGVEVGQVKRIRFDPKNPLKIILTLRVAKTTPITEATQASFEDSPIISLVDEGKNPTALKAKKDQRYPTISVFISSSTTQPFAATPLDNISKNVQETRVLLQNLLNDDNVELLKQLIYSLQQVTGVLAADKEKINSLLIRTEDASTEFKPFLQAGRDTVTTLKTQTLPQLSTMSDNINDTLSDLRELIVSIKRNPSILIRGAAVPELGPGERLQYSQTGGGK